MRIMLVLLALLLGACSQNPAPETTAGGDVDALRTQALAMFGQMPAAMPGAENDTKEQISLGEKLYHDTRLSINDSQSCNSCHNVLGKAGGVDGLPTSPGAKGELGGRNSPTVLNAGLHIAQFWDGRAADLKEQAKGPILNPVEMGMPDEAAVLKKLQATEYPALFAAAFPQTEDALTYDNLAAAIASFERTLLTRDRFDAWLGGDDSALNGSELAGLEAFVGSGCTACHSGTLLGGNMYQKMGAVHPYDTADKGREDVTGKAEDRFVFKVPSLRNIALTGPYFHDGKAATLEDAVKKMAWHQLGRELEPQQISDIVAFLGTLTDTERE